MALMSAPSALLTIIAAMVCGWQLKEVHDLSNMARDVRLVGMVMLASFRKYPSSCGTWPFMCVDDVPAVQGDSVTAG